MIGEIEQKGQKQKQNIIVRLGSKERHFPIYPSQKTPTLASLFGVSITTFLVLARLTVMWETVNITPLSLWRQWSGINNNCLKV
jgi:hypothetical protein